jgi:hypothetical protein
MNQQERSQLLSEQGFLRERLAQTPNSARLTRMSAESRLNDIEQQLVTTVSTAAEPARVRLTFSGRPVVGSTGIFAEFGMKAVNSFSETVAAIAASLSAPLAQMGRIPNRDQNQLLITSTAVGSFGFELEELKNGQIEIDYATPVALAIQRAQNLLHGTQSSDEELADSAAETDRRALDRMRGFLQLLADNEAVCTMQYRGNVVRFSDVGQVKSSIARLSQDNLREEEQTLSGEFQGVLPKSRTFEFRIAGGDDVVRGKVGLAIGDPDFLNQHLHKATRIKVMVTRVGDGRPRYQLLDTPQWAEVIASK